MMAATNVLGRQKRNRSSNFTVSEIECLINEIIKRVSVIENKKTDAVTWKEKEEKWKDLTNAFNIFTGGTRTVKMLRSKYEGVKKGIKRKVASMRDEKFRTGAGSPVEVTFYHWEEKLLQFIPLNVEGLSIETDCNAGILKYESDCPFDIKQVESIVDIEESMMVFDKPSVTTEDRIVLPSTSSMDGNQDEDTKWGSWNPKSPVSKKRKLLSPQEKYSDMSKTHEELIAIQFKVAEEELKKISLEQEYITRISEAQLEKIEMEKENLRKEELRKEELHALQIIFMSPRHFDETNSQGSSSS